MTLAMRALLFAIVLTACSSPSSPAPVTVACPGTDAAAAALGANRPGTMAVSGTATLEIVPDTADMHITLSAERARPKLAAAAVRAEQQALTKALHGVGLADDDVALSYLSISPVYEPRSGVLLGYTAAITVTASTHDFDRLAELMEVAADAGATSTSTDFRVADLATLKKKVRDQAMAALKAKADQTASALGLKLGRITSVAENQGGEAWGWNGSVTVSNSVELQPRTQTGTKADEQSLTLTVTASYELA
jgi:uncharacterized protein YggE